jgi:hypothetical protein
MSGYLLALIVLAQSGDPTGFVDALNTERAARGLSAVYFDETLAGLAASNNVHQLARGLGHFVSGGVGQVAAAGQSGPYGALRDWLFSPGHARILLSPWIRTVGYSQSGTYHTANTGAEQQPGLVIPGPPGGNPILEPPKPPVKVQPAPPPKLLPPSAPPPTPTPQSVVLPASCTPTTCGAGWVGCHPYYRPRKCFLHFRLRFCHRGGGY